MVTRGVPLVLLGCGGVGSTLLGRLQRSAPLLASRYRLCVQPVGLADSSGGVLARDIDDRDAWAQWSELKAAGTKLSEIQGSLQLDEFHASALRYAPEKGVLVDCTATDATTPVIQAWLDAGGCAVLANKKPLTGPLEEFRDLTAPELGGRLKYESTVGAGTSFVACLQRMVAANDDVRTIEGTFSGTLGFLTAGLQDNRSLSSLVREAHASGFTEPDPRDDLSGFDVARKALIMARTCGWTWGFDDMEVEALYPPELQDVSVSEFLDGLTDYDATIAARNAEAQAQGTVLRYVAQVSAESISVGLKAVPLDSPLGRLRGTDNIMQVTSELYVDDAPLVVQGSGAGNEITSAGIIADIVAALQA